MDIYSPSWMGLPLHHKVLQRVIKELPVLALGLAVNFNQKLILRLKLNYDVYATSHSMEYLLMTSSPESGLYRDGYDFNRYPMGKVGARTFPAADVANSISFVGGDKRTPEGEKSLRESILRNIKYQLYNTYDFPLTKGQLLEEEPLESSAAFLLIACTGAVGCTAFIVLACVLFPRLDESTPPPTLAYSLSVLSLTVAAGLGACGFFSYQRARQLEASATFGYRAA
jgi:hypothetical protein